MALVSWEQYRLFENMGNGTASKGYALYQVQNLNVELLLTINVFLLILYLVAPVIKDKFNMDKEIIIDLKVVDLKLDLDIRRFCISVLFILNFSLLFVEKLYSYVL